MTTAKPFIVIAFAACAATAALADAVLPRSVRIDYADLDLSTAKGKKLLERRIGRAIETVCGSYALAHEMAEIESIDKCRANARQGVELQVASIFRKAETRLSSATVRDERN